MAFFQLGELYKLSLPWWVKFAFTLTFRLQPLVVEHSYMESMEAMAPLVQ